MQALMFFSSPHGGPRFATFHWLASYTFGALLAAIAGPDATQNEAHLLKVE